MLDLFDTQDTGRVFATPLGVDFCSALIEGLEKSLAGQPPEAIARVELWVANARMQRRLQTLYLQRGPGFMPRIRPVLALAEDGDLAGLPPAIPPLRLRLELADLISQLMDRIPDLAPRSALYDLADGLADLMGEMYEEGVTPEALASVNVADHAKHWQRAQALLGLISDYVGDEARLTKEARQSRIVARLSRLWEVSPPRHPIIVAGSTGSRGATARFMAAVARLPQGAVILPGIDRDMPEPVWRHLLKGRRQGLAGEDHPQYRLAKFAEVMGLDPWDIPDWPGGSGADPDRTALVSLALRPAPVTDQWRKEGPNLRNLDRALEGVTVVTADGLQMEAAAVALRLREAVALGERAALISPDRRLTRQVEAALDRWGIRPDDSAGAPLSLTAPGRFLRHVAELEAGPADAEGMVVLLKHPLCHSGGDRGTHLKRARDLELDLLRRIPGPPTRDRLVDWATSRKDDPGAMAWVSWIAEHMLSDADPAPQPLRERLTRHLARADALAAGAESTGSGELYEKEPGEAALKLVQDLRAEASAGGAMSALDYRAFFTGLIEDREARTAIYPHSDVLIWGTQEARVQGADIVILAGLNEGIWPAAPKADPWLNRTMRAELGLRLPDRVTGLSAHDFQQAAAAPQVWLTRSRRDEETDTVPSRWLNRLNNLLRGSGDAANSAWKAAEARGEAYLNMAAALVTPEAAEPPEPRPSPVPPVSARPTQLAVTQVETLIRDPYAIYARRVLKLRPLDPLRTEPDARLRGSVMHSVMQRFVDATATGLPVTEAAQDLLLRFAADALSEEAPWPTARRLWYAQFAQAAGFIVRSEVDRRRVGLPLLTEINGTWEVPGTGVTLICKADRIDEIHAGNLAIYDYKTGAPPGEKEERLFTKQLWLEALMAEAGAFGLPPGARVGHIAYIGLGRAPKIVAHAIDRAELGKIGAEFRKRLLHMRHADSGFPSRRCVKQTRFAGEYDHLARYGEWDETQTPVLITVGEGP